MKPFAIVFMAAFWGSVVALSAWCFARILRTEEDRKTGGKSGKP
jgi:hypothetical protein